MLPATLQNLARTIQETCSPRSCAPPLPTGWPDQTLRGLSRASIHEWFNSDPNPAPAANGRKLPWIPSLGPIIHLARQTSDAPIVWIGRRVWPYPRVCPDLLDRSIFIDAKDLAERAWAMDVSLRCPALGAVIADGSGFTMSITRRLQLGAAETGGLGLILRPHDDLRTLSAAQTRWLVMPARSAAAPRWRLRLLRAKGVKLPDITTWTLELNHETGALDLVSDAADRSVTPEEGFGYPAAPRRIEAAVTA